MYIFKNALRNISRSKGRNVLIGLIAFIVALSSCIGLSINHSAVKQQEEGLENLNVTANISVDRPKMMEGASSKSDKQEAFNRVSELSLSELKKYAKANSVKSFDYTLSSSLNAAGKLEALNSSDSSSSSSSEDSNSNKDGSNIGGNAIKGRMGNEGDFTLTGYSEASAMTDFSSNISSITSGNMLTFSSSDMNCIINEELAVLNSLKVGSTIKLSNPNDEDEIYKLKIVGIYKTQISSDASGGPMSFSNSSDPANQIYVNYDTLKSISDKSTKNATTSTDNDGNKTTTAIRTRLTGTYYFENVENYEKFESEAKALGLSDDYTVSSSDITSYEQSVQPLTYLASFSKTFFIIVLIIGGLVLTILNIFNIRERKYEVGVLTAIGMKKGKIAMQFITETFVITLIAIVIGTGIGAVSSPYIANKMITSSAVTSSSNNAPNNAGNELSGSSDSNTSGSLENNNEEKGMGGGFRGGIENVKSMVTDINTSTDFSVIIQLIGICVLLTAVSSMGSVLFILRYEPLKILSERS